VVRPAESNRGIAQVLKVHPCHSIRSIGASDTAIETGNLRDTDDVSRYRLQETRLFGRCNRALPGPASPEISSYGVPDGPHASIPTRLLVRARFHLSFSAPDDPLLLVLASPSQPSMPRAVGCPPFENSTPANSRARRNPSSISRGSVGFPDSNSTMACSPT
jgi:hypothetical protein